MKHHQLCSSLLVASLLSSSVLAYSKVSRYGQARSASQNVAFTVSPIYAASQGTNVDDLRPGEVVNHPSTPKYSTLDEQLLTQLEAGSSGRKKPQERFHPPASFEHVLSQPSIVMRQQSQNNPPSAKDVLYPKPVVSMTYDYPSGNFDSKPMSSAKPTILKDSFPSYAAPFPDTYPTKSKPVTDPIIYDSKPPISYGHPPKSLDYPDHYSPYGQSPYDNDDEVIYDHIPDHFHHYHHPEPPSTTTMEPEPMDQRLNKRPYSYYYIGKKLWYVPLYFSIYFIIYIAALVLKSIARHKINFPAHLAAAAAMDHNGGLRSYQGPGWMDYAAHVLEAIEKYGKTSG